MIGYEVGLRLNIRFYESDGGGVSQPLAAWAAAAATDGFAFIDILRVDAAQREQVRAAGLAVGTADLARPAVRGALAADAGLRRASVEQLVAEIGTAAQLGIEVVWVLLRPADDDSRPEQTLAWFEESFGAVADAARRSGVRIAAETEPGYHPYFSILAGTPESVDALFAAVPEPAFGLAFDPSHLTKSGIDPVRFLGEFGHRVHHVHAKDLTFSEEGLYRYGRVQRPIAAGLPGFPGGYWRFSLPGEGSVDWTALARRLRKIGFAGRVAIEPEGSLLTAGSVDEVRVRLREALAFVDGVEA